MPMLLENNSKVRKSCSLDGGGSGRAEAVGGPRQVEAVVGDPIRTPWSGRKVRRRRECILGRCFSSEDFHFQINTVGYY